jgi:SSS family solute:Na+ symporter
MQTLDYLVFLLYFIGISAYGFWIYKKQSALEAENAQNFFLAEGSLTWWAIGASLIASNISAEQFIGMSGSGFAMGLAIASYEWMAALTLIIVAVFFLPIYLKNKIATMPQFLQQRYDSRVSTIMAIFWLFVYVFVNLTSILYLGALCLETVTGISFMYAVIGLSVFAVFITLGGMKVIGYTDVIQVVILVIGGLSTTYLALDLISGGNGFGGLSILMQKAPEHFHLILAKGQLLKPDGNDAYMDLPGLSVLLGGMWIANLYYWGCNQYITQRALGASLDTGQKGLLFAAFLKLVMPLIVVIPGIAAFALLKENLISGISKPDEAYPVLLQLLPAGLKGLAFAALTAAIVASLAGKANSISTIFTLDIYRNFFHKTASEAQLIKVGRITILVAFAIAIIVTHALKSLDQAFQYIQEYTGFISPGVFAIFILGFFWKRATTNAALITAILSIPISIFLKIMAGNVPFMDRMGIAFLMAVALMVVLSLLDPEKEKRKDNNQIIIETGMFTSSTEFKMGALIVCGILAGLYGVFW